jgi:arginine deiminase
VAQAHYGIEGFGRLKTALLHRPDRALPLINQDNLTYFLFDRVPDVEKYLEEHLRYGELLKSHGVTVHLLSDHVRRNTDLMEQLPNLQYLHDTAAVSSRGAILSRMSSMGRRHEEIVVREALQDLGIPIFYEPPEGEPFEGCLLLAPGVLFVADTERHSARSIEKFIGFILGSGAFDEVLYASIPKERRFMHPDMVLGRVTERLMLCYPPAFLEVYSITREKRAAIDFKAWTKARGIDLIPVSDQEQKQWGCSFVPLEPGVLIHYDIALSPPTVHALEREGVRLICFHPDALLAGGGSLRCLTLRLWRDAGTPPGEDPRPQA